MPFFISIFLLIFIHIKDLNFFTFDIYTYQVLNFFFFFLLSFLLGELERTLSLSLSLSLSLPHLNKILIIKKKILKGTIDAHQNSGFIIHSWCKYFPWKNVKIVTILFMHRCALLLIL